MPSLEPVGAIAGMIEKALEIWVTKENRKYLEAMKDCKEDIRKEWSKGPGKRVHSKIEQLQAKYSENFTAFLQDLANGKKS